MHINSEDKSMNIRTILFLVLFTILVLSSVNNQGDQYVSSNRFLAERELLSGGFLQHHPTVLCSAVSLPDIYDFCESVPRNTHLIPFSIKNKLSESNNRINQVFILTQKTMLTAKPTHLRRMYHHTLPEKSEIPPVLS
jgi:hypothetical protein